jgi:hypothetical protein
MPPFADYSFTLVPSTASWLSEKEKAFIQARLPTNAPRAAEASFSLRELIRTLRDLRVWLFLLCWAFYTVGTTGLQFYQPTVIANLGFTYVPNHLYLTNSDKVTNIQRPIQHYCPSSITQYPSRHFRLYINHYLWYLRQYRTYPTAFNPTWIYDCNTSLLLSLIYISKHRWGIRSDDDRWRFLHCMVRTHPHHINLPLKLF